jgi:hypothetical protein
MASAATALSADCVESVRCELADVAHDQRRPQLCPINGRFREKLPSPLTSRVV